MEDMRRTVNPHTGKPYDVKAVCEALSRPRSTHYARKNTDTTGFREQG